MNKKPLANRPVETLGLRPKRTLFGIHSSAQRLEGEPRILGS